MSNEHIVCCVQNRLCTCGMGRLLKKNKNNKKIGKKAVAKIQMINDDSWNQGDSSTNSRSILVQLPKKV